MHREFRKPPWLWVAGATVLALTLTLALQQLWRDLSRLQEAQIAGPRLEAQLQRTQLLRTQWRVHRAPPRPSAQQLSKAEQELYGMVDAFAGAAAQGDELERLRAAVDRVARARGESAQEDQLFAEALSHLKAAQDLVERDIRTEKTVAQLGTAIAVILLLAVIAHLLRAMLLPKREQAALAERQAQQLWEGRWQLLNERSSDVVAILDCEGVIKYLGGGVENVLGHQASESLGRNVISLLHPDEVALGKQLVGSLTIAPGAVRTEHFRYLHPASGWRNLEVVVRNELHTEGINGIVVNARDVTERVQAQERFRHEAFHDPLTSLPNRAFFMERLQQVVNRCRRDPAYQYAALYLDLDRFKLVNDSFGYRTGDDLLKALAARLRLCIQGPTTLLQTESGKADLHCEHLLARIGGDEFCVLLEQVQQPSAAIRMAERILLRLKDSFFIGQADIFTSASVGVALGNPNYASADEVIRDADIAMYRAKVAGGARLKLYDEDMHQQALRQLRLETDLRRALERREFELVFQPIVLLRGGQLEGVEALIRWRHPQRGLVSPGEFISVAEATGLIVPLGRWMLHESCRQFQSLRQEPGAPRTFSVNFSAQEFSQPDLVDHIRNALESFGVPGECLHVEITESTMMSNVDQVSAMLLALKSLGIRISVDDFGTGYSSLSYLRRLPIDALKIDRSFVLAMERDHESREIVHTILALARTLGLQTIAEGAETAKQVAQLKQMRCTYGQGYFFSKPVDIETLRGRLQYWPSKCPADAEDEGPRTSLLDLANSFAIQPSVDEQEVAEEEVASSMSSPLQWR